MTNVNRAPCPISQKFDCGHGTLLFLDGGINMREGILIPDMQSGRADIRFNADDCYGGLHCGTTMDIWLNEQWIPTRIEMNSGGWYLVGVQVETLWGQRVRIRW